MGLATIRPRSRPGLPRGSRLRSIVLLVFPGLATVTAFMPVITLGPIAFAIREDFAFSTAQIGFASTGYFIASATLTGAGGLLIGRLTTLWVVRVGLSASALLAVAMAFAPSPRFIVATAVGAGAVNGLVTPAINVLITEIVPIRFRGLAFGIKAAAVPGASTLAAGGAWAAATFGISWTMFYWAGGALGLTVAAMTLTLGTAHRASTSAQVRLSAASGAKTSSSLVILGIGGLLGAAGTAILPPFLVDGLIDRGQTPEAAASMLALGSGLGIASRITVGALSDRWREPLWHLRAVVAMLVVAGIGMGTIGLSRPEQVILVATLATFAIGWGWPGLAHYAVIATHPHSPARATSAMQTGTYFGSVVGPLTFGLLAEHVSFPAAWTTAAACVFAAALFLLFGIHRLSAESVNGGCRDEPQAA